MKFQPDDNQVLSMGLRNIAIEIRIIEFLFITEDIYENGKFKHIFSNQIFYKFNRIIN
jgi:hypothetical protein